MKSIGKVSMIFGCLFLLSFCVSLDAIASDYERQHRASERGFDELDDEFDEKPIQRQEPQRQAPAPIEPRRQVRQAPTPPPPPQVIEEEEEPEVISNSSPQSIVKKVEGLTFELKSCSKEGNAVNCNFLITSNYFDRVVHLFFSPNNGKVVRFYDNFGTEHPVHLIRMVEKESRRSYISHQLIADNPIPVTLRFENVSTRTTTIAKLLVGGKAMKNGKRHYFMPEFRDIQITQ